MVNGSQTFHFQAGDVLRSKMSLLCHSSLNSHFSKEKTTLVCKKLNNLLTLLCIKTYKCPRMGGGGEQVITKAASKSDHFPPPLSSVTWEHPGCVRQLAGF